MCFSPHLLDCVSSSHLQSASRHLLPTKTPPHRHEAAETEEWRFMRATFVCLFVCLRDRGRVCRHDNSRKTRGGSEWCTDESVAHLQCSSAVTLPYCSSDWISVPSFSDGSISLMERSVCVCVCEDDEDHCVSLMMVCVCSSAGIKQWWTFSFCLSVYFLKHEIKIHFINVLLWMNRTQKIMTFLY